MSSTMKDRLEQVPTAIGRRVIELIRELAPKVLFFFGVLLLMSLLFKLFVAQYAIEFSGFAKAAVGALILGKVIALLDWAQAGYRFEHQRRIVVIAGKTVVYASAVIVIGIGDRILKAARHAGGFRAGLDALAANANIDRFLGLVLLIGLVVGAYLTLQEINRALGEGVLFRLLFARASGEAGSRSGTLLPAE